MCFTTLALSAPARIYDVRVSTDNQIWDGLGNTDDKVKVKTDNLPVGTLLYIQVRTRNTEHTTPWSASVTTRIFDSAVALAMAN